MFSLLAPANGNEMKTLCFLVIVGWIDGHNKHITLKLHFSHRLPASGLHFFFVINLGALLFNQESGDLTLKIAFTFIRIMVSSFFVTIAGLISIGTAQKPIYSFPSSCMVSGFDSSGRQPSKLNPLGNSTCGQVGEGDKKGTNPNGLNCIDHSVATFMTPLTYSCNHAIGGMVVNDALPHGSGLDLKQQIPELFEKKSFTRPEDSLFIILIGDNDVQYNYILRTPSRGRGHG